MWWETFGCDWKKGIWKSRGVDHTPIPPIQVEEGNHSKGERRWDGLDVCLLLQYQTQGGVFLTWNRAGWGKNNNICDNCCPAACNPWPNFLWWGENVVVVARNSERMGRDKVHGCETACHPHSWMVVMELLEGDKWRHKCLRNRNYCGQTSISK